MRRGEVWWADLPSPIGRRPVVLLSRDEAYAVRNAVTVAEVTSTIRGIPVEVDLGPEDGLPKKCVVNLDTIGTIRKNLLIERITILLEEKIQQINIAVKFALSPLKRLFSRRVLQK
jgi:mRNA interferase MazF